MYRQKPANVNSGFGFFTKLFAFAFIFCVGFIAYQMFVAFQMQQACLASKDLKSFECQMISHRQNVNLDITNR